MNKDYPEKFLQGEIKLGFHKMDDLAFLQSYNEITPKLWYPFHNANTWYLLKDIYRNRFFEPGIKIQDTTSDGV